MKPGLFITFEGIDGAGKSSHIEGLAAAFRAQGRTVTVTREPGGTPLSEKLREMVLNDPMDPLTESLLIVHWLENRVPDPSLLGPDPTAVLSRAGIAMGVIDAAVHTLIGRKITDAGFDESPVGLRRRRTMVQGLLRLDADPPAYDSGTPTLDVVAAVVALDYIDFRFPQAAWLPALVVSRRSAEASQARPQSTATVPRRRGATSRSPRVRPQTARERARSSPERASQSAPKRVLVSKLPSGRPRTPGRSPPVTSTTWTAAEARWPSARTSNAHQSSSR